MLGTALNAVGTAREAHGRVATPGFSSGGGLSLMAATTPWGPDAAISYCGEPRRHQSLSGTGTPMLATCASLDELMSPLIPGFVEAALGEENDPTVKSSQAPARLLRRDEEGQVQPGSCRGGVEPHGLVPDQHTGTRAIHLKEIIVVDGRLRMGRGGRVVNARATRPTRSGSATRDQRPVSP